jgi:Arf-GAP/SH3 domain/ANK repeat/PH domain-containing protein
VPSLLLKIPNVNKITFQFTVTINPGQLPINSLTFVSSTSPRDLDNFITTEFFHNPNIQNEDNVALLGDVTQTTDLNFTWTCPSQQTKTAACFAEYDKHDHTLHQLAQFTIWLDNTEPLSLLSTISPSPEHVPSRHQSNSPVSLPIQAHRPTPSSSQPSLNTTTAAATATATATVAQAPIDINSPKDTPPIQETLSSPESIGRVLQKEKSTMVPRPDNDSISQPEDGPLFRATIASLEKKTGNLKTKVKRVYKKAALVHERQLALAEAQREFTHALHDAAASEFPAFRPIVYNYFERVTTAYPALVDFNRQSAIDMQVHVVEPIRKLYELEIKVFDIRKREFDDESSQYYSWLSRYLSMKQEAKGKKKLESDSKYLEKRKAFELSRFDYYSYMQDLHGGRKQQDVTYQLALYAESEANRFILCADKMKVGIKAELDSVISEVKNANKDWSRQRTEREDRRRALERSIMSPDSETPEHGLPHQPPALRLVTSGMPASGMATSQGYFTGSPKTAVSEHRLLSSAAEKHYDSSDEEDDDTVYPAPSEDAHRKEGLLWAMSRPGGLNDPLPNLNKQGWHKFWVVLAGGKLCEYTNWKQGLELHNEPIDLKVACVREARNAERRFCFEMVTPTYKRVYQSTSDEDMHSWIRAINNGITSSLEANSLKPLSSITPSSRQRAATADDEDDTIGSKKSVKKKPDEELLRVVQKLSPTNQVCADCGVPTKVEWISINLLVVLCIDCSGVHRSLGSHISKIRSLTLDTVSFTPELIELIQAVTNGQVNSIWERNLFQKSQINEKTRRTFISEKYVEKKFVRPLDRPNAELRKAVGDQDVLKVLESLASRANPNSSVDGEHAESMLVYALRSAPRDAKTFPLAELLILNSATVPATTPTGLSSCAKVYLASKIAREGPKKPDRLQHSLSMADKKANVGAKIQKRLSVGFSGKQV